LAFISLAVCAEAGSGPISVTTAAVSIADNVLRIIISIPSNNDIYRQVPRRPSSIVSKNICAMIALYDEDRNND